MTLLTYVQPDGNFSNMLKGCIQYILVSTKIGNKFIFVMCCFKFDKYIIQNTNCSADWTKCRNKKIIFSTLNKFASEEKEEK